MRANIVRLPNQTPFLPTMPRRETQRHTAKLLRTAPHYTKDDISQLGHFSFSSKHPTTALWFLSGSHRSESPHRGRSLRTMCGDSDPCGKVGRRVQHFAPSNMRYCRGLYHGLHCCTSAPRRSVLVSNLPIYNCEDWINFFKSLPYCFHQKWKTIPTHPNRPTYVNPTRAKPRTNHMRPNDRNQLDSTKQRYPVVLPTSSGQGRL